MLFSPTNVDRPAPKTAAALVNDIVADLGGSVNFSAEDVATARSIATHAQVEEKRLRDLATTKTLIDKINQQQR